MTRTYEESIEFNWKSSLPEFYGMENNIELTKKKMTFNLINPILNIAKIISVFSNQNELIAATVI